MTRQTIVSAYARKAMMCHRSAQRFARWGDWKMASECLVARQEFIALARTARNLAL